MPTCVYCIDSYCICLSAGVRVVALDSLDRTAARSNVPSSVLSFKATQMTKHQRVNCALLSVCDLPILTALCTQTWPIPSARCRWSLRNRLLAALLCRGHTHSIIHNESSSIQKSTARIVSPLKLREIKCGKSSLTYCSSLSFASSAFQSLWAALAPSDAAEADKRTPSSSFEARLSSTASALGICLPERAHLVVCE